MFKKIKAHFRNFNNCRETGKGIGERRMLIDKQPDLSGKIKQAIEEFDIPYSDGLGDVKEYHVGENGQFSTINDALENIESGSRILLEPGVYKENLNPFQPVEIVGPEEGEAKIYAAPDGAVICSESPYCYVKNVTMINTAGPWYTAYTFFGWLILDSCRVEGVGAGAGAMNQAGVYFKDCLFINCEGAALYVQQNSKLLAVNCEITDNVYGVSVQDSSTYILGCKIRNCPRGFYVERGGDNYLVGCEIVHSSEIPVTLIKNEKFLMEHCSVAFSEGQGVVIEKTKKAAVISNEILRTKSDAIQVAYNSKVMISKNRIEQSNNNGIWCDPSCKGVIKGNRIKDVIYDDVKLLKKTSFKVS